MHSKMLGASANVVFYMNVIWIGSCFAMQASTHDRRIVVYFEGHEIGRCAGDHNLCCNVAAMHKRLSPNLEIDYAEVYGVRRGHHQVMATAIPSPGMLRTAMETTRP